MVRKSTDDSPFYDFPEPAPTEQPQAPEPQKLFDITCVIGSVYAGGTEDPRMVAFALIGQAGHDGDFTFPNPDGKTFTRVLVSTEGTPGAEKPNPNKCRHLGTFYGDRCNDCGGINPR